MDVANSHLQSNRAMTILLNLDNTLATITLNRPEKYNALDPAMLAQLQTALKQTAEDKSIRAVILTGAGKGFCAGADLTEFSTHPNIADSLRNGFNPVIQQMRSLEKPIICAINGVTAGAGTSLALASDYRIACDTADFVFAAFMNIGLIPDAGSTYLLQRIVGSAKAFELFMLADADNRVSASMALGLGIVHRVVVQDKLDKVTSTVASKLATMPTRAIGLMKSALNYAAEHTLEQTLEFEAQLQTQAASTQDFQAGVAAFLQKRQPTFKGE